MRCQCFFLHYIITKASVLPQAGDAHRHYSTHSKYMRKTDSLVRVEDRVRNQAVCLFLVISGRLLGSKGR